MGGTGVIIVTYTAASATPTISSQPANQTANAGRTATFSVSASATAGTRSYQWQKKPSGGSWADISGATSASYTTPTLVAGDNSAEYRVVVTNTESGKPPTSVTSNAATLTVTTPAPSISTQPQAVSKLVGETATFSVTASPATGYQWQSKPSGGSWADISGATSATYTKSALGLADDGVEYRVVVTNTVAGLDPVTTTSTAALLTVKDPSVAPTIDTQPQPQTEDAGTKATFSVTASASPGTLSYQWQKKPFGGSWADISGATSASYTTPDLVGGDDKAEFRVVVINTEEGKAPTSVTSTAAAVTVTSPAPVISTQPQSQLKAVGATATFSVTASASPGTVTYQWQWKGPGDADFFNIDGATVASFTTDTLVMDYDGVQFRVLVTNTVEGLDPVTTTSDVATLTVREPSVAPTIDTQPQPQTEDAGTKATFSVTASALPGTLSYQWQKKPFGGSWADISGATSASYTTPDLVGGDDKAEFRVVVINTESGKAPTSVTSTAAAVTVTSPAPVISAQPQPQTEDAGTKATFSVTASALPGTVTYQWQSKPFGGSWVDISGATSASYTTPDLAGGDDQAEFRVKVINTVTGLPSVTTESASAKLTVTSPAPVITAQPQPQTEDAGTKATFSVTASASPGTVTYQWQKKPFGGSWVDISGATSASYTTPDLAGGDDQAEFRVKVINTVAGLPPVTTESAPASLTVTTASPEITAQPLPQTEDAGKKATFSVTASASPGTLSYQWQKKVGGSWADIAGADQASYTTPDLVAGDDGAEFRVKVTHTVTGLPPVTTESDPAAVTVTTAKPEITSQPKPETRVLGEKATFSVITAVPPAGTLTYQWQKKVGDKWEDITGAYQPEYTTDNLTGADNGTQYRVKVTNTVDGLTPPETTTSDVVSATVTAPAPVISGQPKSVDKEVGQKATFSVTASVSPGTLAYQWQKKVGDKWEDITGATGNSYTTPDLALADHRALFRVVITNDLGDGSTPTAVVSEVAQMFVRTLAPINDNSRIPSGGLPQGDTVLLIDGQPSQVNVRPTSGKKPKGLVFVGDGFTMQLEGRGGSGESLGLSEDNVLILQSTLSGAQAQGAVRAADGSPEAFSSGTGFKPNSVVRLYILPDLLLGELNTDASGAYSGSVPVPSGLKAGSYTLQANGFTPDERVRSLSLGVKVVNVTGKKVQKSRNSSGKPPKAVKKRGITVMTSAKARTNAGQRIRTTVRCSVGSSALGEQRYCQVIRGRNGKTVLRTFGHDRLKVVLVQYAPATKTYTAYRKVTVYRNGQRQ